MSMRTKKPRAEPYRDSRILRSDMSSVVALLWVSADHHDDR
jgi:hypothetical protein